MTVLNIPLSPWKLLIPISSSKQFRSSESKPCAMVNRPTLCLTGVRLKCSPGFLLQHIIQSMAKFFNFFPRPWKIASFYSDWKDLPNTAELILLKSKYFYPLLQKKDSSSLVLKQNKGKLLQSKSNHCLTIFRVNNFISVVDVPKLS